MRRDGSETVTETEADLNSVQIAAVSVVLLVFVAGVFGFVFLMGDSRDSGETQVRLTADFRMVETDNGTRVILQSTNAEVVYLAEVGGGKISGTEMYDEGDTVTTERNQFDVVAKSGNRSRVVRTVTGGVTPVG
ncbi:MAG: hypothetical protein SV253_08960 [Halobacteria archaeon]|nr:hypothetical protein [Halobacteria archaeon]